MVVRLVTDTVETGELQAILADQLVVAKSMANASGRYTLKMA